MLNNLKNRVARAGKELLGKGSGTIQKFREVPGISPEEVSEAKAFFPLDKFFIFGHARSGTTLLARLIRLHPQVHCNYQAHFFTRSPLLESMVNTPEIGAWLTRPSNRWNRGCDLSPVLLRAAADFLLEREARQVNKGNPGCMVGDKSPNSLNDGRSVELMYKVYPDAFLIYIIRDGRDTIISHRFQNFIDNANSLSTEDLTIRAEFSKNPDLYLTGQRSIFTPKGIRVAAQRWIKNVEETHQLGQELYGPRYHWLRYEDLLKRPEEIMGVVWAFLGIDPSQPGLPDIVAAEMQRNPDADWQKQKAGVIASPLRKGKYGSWTQILTSEDKNIFNDIAGQTLQKWGYQQ